MQHLGDKAVLDIMDRRKELRYPRLTALVSFCSKYRGLGVQVSNLSIPVKDILHTVR